LCTIRLENLSLKEILEKMNDVMTEIERVLKSSDLDTLMASVRGSLCWFEQLIGEVRAEIPAISSSVKATSEAARSALQAADRVIAETGTRVNEIAPSVHGATDAAEAALVQAKETLSMRQGVVGQIATSVLDTLAEARKNLTSVEKILVEVNAVAAAGADMAVPVHQTLEEIRAMARSIRALSDYLERYPEALLRGKASPEGN
jgi:paraquat-inducible protein B